MAGSKALRCGSCAYWEPYHGWEGVGKCDQELSRRYGHMAAGSDEPCDQYAPSAGATTGQEGPSQSPQSTVCEDCHYWFPFELMPRVGQCDNPSSRRFKEPTFSDKPVEECFVTRSLEGLEFMWCQTHRQTIFSAELPEHWGCRVLVSSVGLPVEDEMELTLAGD